jgi:hypothetical protein
MVMLDMLLTRPISVVSSAMKRCYGARLGGPGERRVADRRPPPQHPATATGRIAGARRVGRMTTLPAPRDVPHPALWERCRGLLGKPVRGAVISTPRRRELPAAAPWAAPKGRFLASQHAAPS